VSAHNNRYTLTKSKSPLDSIQVRKLQNKNRTLWVKLRKLSNEHNVILKNHYRAINKLVATIQWQDLLKQERDVNDMGRFCRYVNSKMKSRPHIVTIKSALGKLSTDGSTITELFSIEFQRCFSHDDGALPTKFTYNNECYTLSYVEFSPDTVWSHICASGRPVLLHGLLVIPVNCNCN